MSKSTTKSSNSKTYASRNNVYKTENGTFVARKMVNGKKYSKTFALKREAVAYITRFDAMITRFGKKSYKTKTTS